MATKAATAAARVQQTPAGGCLGTLVVMQVYHQQQQ
jgi:hypothetical protein